MGYEDARSDVFTYYLFEESTVKFLRLNILRCNIKVLLLWTKCNYKSPYKAEVLGSSPSGPIFRFYSLLKYYKDLT